MTPHKPGIDVIIGIGKPKGGLPPRPAGPSAKPSAGSDPDDALEQSGSKASPDDAQVFHSDQNCGACDNFDEATGSCKVVDGQFTPDMGCIAYFEPKGSEAAEPNAPGGPSGAPAPTPAIPGLSQ